MPMSFINIDIPETLAVLIEDESEDYADQQNSAYTNDLYGFQAGAEFMYKYLISTGVIKKPE